jgi:hypothetical protein
MKALIFIIALALMPTLFKGQTVVVTPPFSSESFNYKVDSTLHAVKTDTTKVVKKKKSKTRKEQGKTPLLLEIGKYAVGVVLSFFLACPPK